MNVLITGGCGFIGTYVKKKLLKQEHSVYIVDNFSTGNRENVSEKEALIKGDIVEESTYEKLEDTSIDTIIHLAAQTSVPNSLNDPIDDMKTNIEGTIKLLQFAIKNKVKRFIFASSAAVYGDNKNIPIKEDQPLYPSSPYGISKMTAESYIKTLCELNNIEYVILRFSNVYGPKQSQEGEGGVIKGFIDQLSQNKQPFIYGDGNQTRDFIYVEDIAEAHLVALDVKSGIYNLSSKIEISINSIYEIIAETMGKNQIKAIKLNEREGDIYKSCLDNQKFKRASNWSLQYPIEEGLRKTILDLQKVKS
ncbi:NAD-dependent epimerase/dehydratase family protein [Metabacillus halosaccharovorans]|uniref:NAD-dependent epimerase/dehydratase family protein n=1 Tax=Metabacillus halosaccharovorans TaxID=930124 RepID=UPI001C200197|nr:NAD-dependent epimerase/dehydratase family protein [Metabacillus halosaccharovorans]